MRGYTMSNAPAVCVATVDRVTQPRRTKTLLAAGATLGLASVSVVHALWAAGPSWPAHNERALADLVVGSPTMPAREASVVVALGSGAAALCVAGVGGHGSVAVFARRAVGIGLLTRALAGGVVAADVLGLPEPGSRFRELDNTVYRPLCLALGAATFASARR